MDISTYYDAEFAEHRAIAEATAEAAKEPFLRLLAICAEAVRSGRKIVFFGNGGSAADAQHLAAELVVRFEHDRAPIAALALTTDSSTLTAIGNDLGFEQLFARQVRALCVAGDVTIAVTTSGKSRNVIRGLEAAREIGAVAAALSGGRGGELPGLADPLVLVPSTTTARVQEMHITLGQILCGALEIELGLVEAPAR